MVEKIKSYISKYLNRILVFIGFLFMLSLLITSIRSCQDYKDINNNNVVALTDSIKYYKTKYGEVYVSKTLLEGDLSTLKIVNDSLYQTIKDMKLNKPTSVVYIDNTIDNGSKDTSWVIPPIPSNDDSIIAVYPMITRNFEFNNKFRESNQYKNNFYNIKLFTIKTKEEGIHFFHVLIKATPTKDNTTIP